MSKNFGKSVLKGHKNRHIQELRIVLTEVVDLLKKLDLLLDLLPAIIMMNVVEEVVLDHLHLHMMIQECPELLLIMLLK